MPMLREVPSRRIPIREGVAGTIDTVELMRQLVMAGKSDPVVRVFTAELVNDVSQGNKRNRFGEVKKVFDFVSNEIRYVWDVEGVETLHTPRFILENGYGDCDDKTVLACAMLSSIGHKTRIHAIGMVPDVFAHVYGEVKIFTSKGPKWLALDCTEDRPIGWSPQASIHLIRHCK